MLILGKCLELCLALADTLSPGVLYDCRHRRGLEPAWDSQLGVPSGIVPSHCPSVWVEAPGLAETPALAGWERNLSWACLL